jgi:hypothetical protein
MTDDKLCELANERDPLALRRLMGEPLSAAERARLDALNAALDASLPKPLPFPPEIRAAMAAARRLLLRQEGGR